MVSVNAIVAFCDYASNVLDIWLKRLESWLRIEFILDKPLFDVDLRENLLFNTEPSLLFKTEPDSSSFDDEN
jgi:hypothetical protein